MGSRLLSSFAGWADQAKCKGQTDLFFGKPKEKPWIRHKRETAAISICNSCSALHQCRQYARENKELGVWGGETEDERYAAGYLKDPDVVRRNKDREKREKIAGLI